MSLVLLSAAGCEKAAESNEQEEAPAAATKVLAKRWVKSTPEAIKKGKASFGTCMGCHGASAEGKVGIGPRIASETYLAAASDDFLFNTIKNGRTGTTMIPWGAMMDDGQIEGIIAYLRSLHPSEPAELDESPLAGNAEHGAKVFRDVCSGCHGRSGAGYQETANGTGIGRKVFLDSASDGFMRYIVHNGKTLTKMRGFGKEAVTAVANLEDREIEDAITHLRTHAW